MSERLRYQAFERSGVFVRVRYEGVREGRATGPKQGRSAKSTKASVGAYIPWPRPRVGTEVEGTGTVKSGGSSQVGLRLTRALIQGGVDWSAWHAESPGAKLQVGRSSKVFRLTSLIERPSSPKHMRASRGSAQPILARGRGGIAGRPARVFFAMGRVFVGPL